MTKALETQHRNQQKVTGSYEAENTKLRRRVIKVKYKMKKEKDEKNAALQKATSLEKHVQSLENDNRIFVVNRNKALTKSQQLQHQQDDASRTNEQAERANAQHESSDRGSACQYRVDARQIHGLAESCPIRCHRKMDGFRPRILLHGHNSISFCHTVVFHTVSLG